jgi:hypothetical protein
MTMMTNLECYNRLVMWLGWGRCGKHTDFGGEQSWKVAALETEKELG